MRCDGVHYPFTSAEEVPPRMMTLWQYYYQTCLVHCEIYHGPQKVCKRPLDQSILRIIDRDEVQQY